MAGTRKRFAQVAFYVALAAAILGAIALPAWAAEPSRPLLTITDGPVQVLRGAQKFDAAEGLSLADDDIVRTPPATRVARIEFADGRALDLGPATQVLLLSERAAQAQGWAGATALVLQGWAKLTAGAAASRLVMPHGVVVGEARGVLLAHTAGDGAALAFAESNGLTLLPRGAGGAEVLLREGESWTRDAASGAARVSTRLAGVRDVPRALADTLPRRAAQWAGRAREAADGQPLDATDLAAWQQAEPKLLAQWRTPNNATAQRTGNPAARLPNALNSAANGTVKTASHNNRPRRAVVLGLPLPAAARRSAAATALPTTAYLTIEPVGSLRLPSSLSPAQPQ
jgi:hypothetical protein